LFIYFCAMKSTFRTKIAFLIASVLCCIVSTTAARAGQDMIPFADPFVLYDGGTYYMYGTCSDLGIGVVVSEDLDTWTVPDGREMWFALSRDDSYGNRWFWAPEVYRIGEKYLMYYSAEEHICAAFADSPLGPFVQKEKKPMLNEKGIDNSLFIDDDGKAYIFWVRFNDGNEIWSAELGDDLCTIKQETMKFCIRMSQEWERFWPSVNEGPFVVKHNGTYYLTYSANSYESQDYAIGYAISRKIGKKWKKYKGNPVLRRPDGMYGVGHHAFFTDAKGNSRIAFHSHFNEERISPRVIRLSSWSIDSDGILRIDSENIKNPTLQRIDTKTQ